MHDSSLMSSDGLTSYGTYYTTLEELICRAGLQSCGFNLRNGGSDEPKKSYMHFSIKIVLEPH